MMQGEETQVKETKKHFIIITPNFLEASTGGLVWLDQFAKYARTVYAGTTILDVMELKPWIRKNRLINILYYFVWLFRKNNAFIFVDQSAHALVASAFNLHVAETKLLCGHNFPFAI
jgi:hypothetical protein